MSVAHGQYVDVPCDVGVAVGSGATCELLREAAGLQAKKGQESRVNRSGVMLGRSGLNRLDVDGCMHKMCC